MFTIGWWLRKCSALLKNLIPAISGPWCRKTHECANYWLIVTSFLENLALISRLGYGWFLTKKTKQWCSTHTAQVWRLSTCLSRWICTTPHSPGCNRNLALIVTILLLSSQVQHHTILIFIPISFVSAILLLLIPHCLHLCCKLTFLISIIFNSMVGVGEVQLFQVSRDPCTTVHMRETQWRPLSSLPKSLPSLPQSGSQSSIFRVHLTELFAQSSLIKDCDLCRKFCVLLCFTPVCKWNSHCQHWAGDDVSSNTETPFFSDKNASTQAPSSHFLTANTKLTGDL